MNRLQRNLFALLDLFLAPLLGLIVGVALLLRPTLRCGLNERLGGLPAQQPGRIWVHGASMGEARAGGSLLLQLERLGFCGFGSSGTSSGTDVLKRVAPEIPSSFAPFDHPLCVARALDRVRPRALVLIETELWPSLILGASRRKIPIWIVSGRLSDKSFSRYRRLRWLVAPVLRQLEGVAARSQADATRFAALGVPAGKIRVLGDLKLDPTIACSQIATDLVRATSSVAIFVAGSTHRPEEQAALDALAACQAHGFELALVVAPRHMERLAEVEQTIRASGRRLQLRSQLAGQRLANGDVLLLDSIGELAALYATAQVAFVGGTLAKVGGHNLLEPLFEGCPVLFGPHLSSVRDNASLARDSGAGIEVEDADELARALLVLIADPKEARAQGERAKQFLESHRGSTTRAAQWIADALIAAEPIPA